jgi:hypothetical protein
MATADSTAKSAETAEERAAELSPLLGRTVARSVEFGERTNNFARFARRLVDKQWNGQTVLACPVAQAPICGRRSPWTDLFNCAKYSTSEGEGATS